MADETGTVTVLKERRGNRRVPDTNLEFFEDCETGDRPEPEPVKAPEPLKRVKVLHPFSVSHEGVSYWPNVIVEVPESIADKWLRSNWVTDDANN
jgi:hypothetical protein